MTIQMNDLVPADRQALTNAWGRVLKSGRFILGNEAEQFEREWGDYCGGYCVAVGSGFDALNLCLRLLEIRDHDGVIAPSNTCIPTWLAAMATGADIVPVEPDEQMRCIDPAKINAAITYETKVIIPVHLYGVPADVRAIEQIALDHGLFVIEDACQAHGSAPIGHSQFTCYSFYPTKNLGALGDAGAIIVHDLQAAKELMELRNYGKEGAINSRMDELQAAILRERLPMLDTWNRIRQEHAGLYLAGLAGIPSLALPIVPNHTRTNWHQFVIEYPRRDELRAFLKSRDIETLIHYPVPPHRALGLRYHLPIADRLSATVLSLPIAPHLTHRDIERVIANIREFCECAS